MEQMSSWRDDTDESLCLSGGEIEAGGVDVSGGEEGGNQTRQKSKNKMNADYEMLQQ